MEEWEMTSERNEGRKTSNEVKQQQPTSQKSPGGSPKLVPLLGVLLSLQKSPKNIKINLFKVKNN